MRLHDKFVSWVNKWREENVTSDDESRTTQWLLGDVIETKDCETTCRKVYNQDRAPYYEYNKYTVEFFVSSEPEKVTE